MKLDTHYEYLAKLYLRLKGYYVNNLIIHSADKGSSGSELDIIAVRLPFHLQKDRQVLIEDFLNSSSSSVQVIIADVKNYAKWRALEYNKGLRRNDDSIGKMLEWIGCFQEVTPKIVEEIKFLLNLHDSKKLENFPVYSCSNSIGNFELKFTFFCPQLSPWTDVGYKYVDGEEMMNFIWTCLNDQTVIDTCSRKYNTSGWMELELYVLFFKRSQKVPLISEFEAYFK